jgi:integrase/recombinase XerD
MTGQPTTPLTAPPLVYARSDSHLVELWLNRKPLTTQDAYLRDLARFRSVVRKPLQQVTLGDLQRYAGTLTALATASQRRYLSVVKSLFAFGYRLGYFPFNVGQPFDIPKRQRLLAKRIISEAAIQRMLALEDNPRNHAILRLFYNAGCRVSELCRLTWDDCQERAEDDGQIAGQIAVRGKGDKVRNIRISVGTWQELLNLRGEAAPDQPVSTSRKEKGHLDRSQVRRIVLAAAQRAGVSGRVSPHWLRHAHASHALDRGAALHLVQTTLGHQSVDTTSQYLHARPGESSGKYLAI